MKEITQEDLIGYLLGALEPEEERDIDIALAESIALRHRLAALEEQLTNMPDRFVEVDPPAGLADKTLNTISIVDSSMDSQDVSSRPATPEFSSDVAQPTHVKLAPAKEVCVEGRSWSVMDMIVGAAVCFVTAVVLLPSISNSRFHSNRLHCQENLRNIGFSMASIADSFDGSFLLPQETDHWPASMFVQRILDTGLANDIDGFICPNDPGKEKTAQICRKAWCDIRLVMPEDDFVAKGSRQNKFEKHNWATDETVAQKAVESEMFQRSVLQMSEAASGSYGFPAPQVTANGFQEITIPCSPNYVLCADAACFDNPGYRSRNHGGKGQNVLLGDLSVDFICDTACLPSGDHIYTNNQGRIQPGISPGDNLIYRGVIQVDKDEF